MARQSADALRSGLRAPPNAHSTFPSEPGPCRQPRPQTRLAATTPSVPMTYGKKNSKALSLTGNQFKKSDIFTTPQEDDSGSQDGQRYAPMEFSSRETSPVPSDKVRKQVDVPKQDGSKVRRRPLAGAPASRSIPERSPVPSQPLRSRGERSATVSPTESAESTKSKSKVQKAPRCPKPPAKRRLPVNELLLLPGLPDDESAKAPYLPRKAIVGHLRSAMDNSKPSNDSSDSSEETTRASLSAIRKRLKTPKLKHKTIQELQQRHRRLRHRRSKKLRLASLQYVFGDGFETSELTISHHSRLKAEHLRRQRQPLRDEMSALSLTTGPLPDVEFTKSDDTDSLPPSSHHASLEIVALRETRPSPETGEDLEAQEINFESQSCKRSASFQRHVDDFVAAELSSISAPRREYSASIDDDEESEDDDAVESGLEGLSQISEDEDEDDIMVSDEERPVAAQFRSPSPDGELSRHFESESAFHASPAVQPSQKNGAYLDFRRSVTPGYFQASRMGQGRLVEVNEVIDDAPEQDFSNDMLLESPTPSDVGDDIDSDNGRVEYQDESLNYTHDISMAAKPATSMPRSILKNLSSHVPIDTHYSRPESTAANTRRNSIVEFEDSRYFSNATDQLDISPPRRHITRTKSYNYRSRSFEVLDRDHFVTETSPEPPDYTNTTQVAALRQLQETLRPATPALGRVRDLKAFTRSISREHGTLGQSVRRRPSMYFQSSRPVQ